MSRVGTLQTMRRERAKGAAEERRWVLNEIQGLLRQGGNATLLMILADRLRVRDREATR